MRAGTRASTTRCGPRSGTRSRPPPSRPLIPDKDPDGRGGAPPAVAPIRHHQRMTAPATTADLPPATPRGRGPASVRRALLTWIYRRGRLQLGLLLLPPLAWLGLLYLGSLAILFLTSLWHLNPEGRIVRDIGLVNFQTLLDPAKPYLRVTLHT